MFRRLTFLVAGVFLAVIGLGVVVANQDDPKLLGVGFAMTIAAAIVILLGLRRH